MMATVRHVLPRRDVQNIRPMNFRSTECLLTCLASTHITTDLFLCYCQRLTYGER